MSIPRLLPLLLSLPLTTALAADVVKATLADGMTGAKVSAATARILVATFPHNGKTAEVYCMGADAGLSCEVQNSADHSVVAASTTLQFCHSGDNIVLMSDQGGLSGHWIGIPHAALNRSGTAECKG